jgi:hypothetical protein
MNEKPGRARPGRTERCGSSGFCSATGARFTVTRIANVPLRVHVYLRAKRGASFSPSSAGETRAAEREGRRGDSDDLRPSPGGRGGGGGGIDEHVRS